MEKECLICADKMKGQVIMECGHMCCTTCFAKHSRINNTCPFCRAEFAPPVIKKEKMSLEVAEAMASLTVIESKDLSRELLSTMMSSEQHIAPVVQSRLLQKFDDILLNTAFRAVSNTVHWYDYENPINIQRERSNVFEPYNSNLNYDNDFNEIIQDLQEIAEENHNNRSYGDTMLTAMAEIPILEKAWDKVSPLLKVNILTLFSKGFIKLLFFHSEVILIDFFLFLRFGSTNSANSILASVTVDFFTI